MSAPPSQYRRFYEIAGVTLQVECELPITATTFAPKFASFEELVRRGIIVTVVVS